MDFGLGNLRSVQKALEYIGVPARIGTKVPPSGKLILPGVGAFGAAMPRLLPLREDLRRFAAEGHPVLGICLGQQLLFDASEERGEHEGLGLVPGRVRYLPPGPGLKIPHVGWSPLVATRPNPLTEGLEDGEQTYFVHSLFTDCADPRDIVATAHYGISFPAAIQRGNVWGCQFHPEKSSRVGLHILRNFVAC